MTSPSANGDYKTFLAKKSQVVSDCGFDPLWMPEFLYDFQRHLVEWALRKGRAAIFADCGLGKTPMQLVWAENVVRKTNKPVLILTPLAVSGQTIREAEKFGIGCEKLCSNDGWLPSKIYVLNYEQLHHYSPEKFGGVVCDESSVMKNFAGKRRALITEFLRTRPYRLLCTATAAPNDHWELGTSSEALGYLGHADMLSRFFKQDTSKDHLGWGRTTYRFRGHAEHPFWRWVVSWARACRRPSDLSYSDDRFTLPPLDEQEHIIETDVVRPGMLFAIPARTLPEQRDERRATMTHRCEAIADLVGQHNGASVSWCHLNEEGKLLAKSIPEAVEVAGHMPLEEKEEKLLAFQTGQITRLVTKPKIGCFGLNWQHCHHVTCFPSHSWEQYYQAVRRCWRFGQTEPVRVDIVTTDGELAVLRNLQRKATQADAMFTSLARLMGEELAIERGTDMTQNERMPQWL